MAGRLQSSHVQFSASFHSTVNIRKFAHKPVPLLPNSVSCYHDKLGGQQVHHATHWPCLATSAGVWLRTEEAEISSALARPCACGSKRTLLSCDCGRACHIKTCRSINQTNYFIVRLKVDQRAGQLSLPHLGITKTEKNRTKT